MDFNVSIFPGLLLQTGTAKTKLVVLLDPALKYICRVNNFVVVDLHLVLRVSALLYGSLVEKTIYTTLLNWSDFLLQKLYSYGEALNLSGAMIPLVPISAAYGTVVY